MKRCFLAAALSVGLLAAQTANRVKAAELKTYLGLSDTQASSLEQIRENARQEMQPLRDTLRTKAKALRDQTKAGSTDATALGQLMIDLQNARKALEPIQTRAHDQALAVLTPDQKTKLAQLEAGSNRGREWRQAVRLGLLAPVPGGKGAGARLQGRRGRV